MSGNPGLAEDNREILTLRFKPADEASYREFRRGRARYSRAGLFLVLALIFGSFPLYQDLMFSTQPQLQGMLALLNAGLVGPALLIAAFLSYLTRRRALTGIIQALAVIAACGMVLAHRYLALQGDMQFSAAFTGALLIAICVFGCFDWRRMALLALLASSAAVTTEWVQASDHSDPLLQTFLLSLLGVVAILGSYHQDALSRWAWADFQRLRQTRSEMKEGEQRFRAFLEFLPAIAFIKDRHGHYLVRNKAHRDRFGEDSGDWVGRRASDLFTSPQAVLFRETDLRVLQTGKSIQFETTNTDRDGRVSELWIQKFPVEDGSGKTYIGGIGIDITERNRFQRELLISEERFRILSELIPVQTWSAAPDGRIEFTNATVTGFLGCTEEDLVSKDWAPYVHPEDQERLRNHQAQMQKSQPPPDFEVRLRAGNGEYRWHVMRVKPLLDERGRVTKWLASNTDIESLKQAAAAVQAATEAKAAFFANMSHEIRTPMNAIVGMTDMLLESGQSAEQREWTEIVRDSGKHLLTIINDILDISKLEAGKLRLEKQRFPLRICVNSAVDLLRITASQRKIVLAQDVSADTPMHVVGDPSRLRQVLLNFLSNAVKFSPDGGMVLLRVSVQADGNDRKLVFAVIDRGIGIAKEHLQNLFKPFSQAEDSTTRRFGGTGLGLSISKALVDLMGGEIKIESQPGSGSSFSFTIPLEEAGGAAAGAELLEPAAPARAVSAQIPHDLGIKNPLRLLIAEDNAVNRKVAELLFRRLGYSPAFVTNGQELLDAVAVKNFDVLFMDMQMPVMSGLVAARELCKRYPPERRPRIIFMTANAMEQHRMEAFEAGASDYILKPVTVEILAAALARCTPLNTS